MIGSCDGNGFMDVITCRACKISCSNGQYLSGTCINGTDNSDVTTCKNCN